MTNIYWIEKKYQLKKQLKAADLTLQFTSRSIKNCLPSDFTVIRECMLIEVERLAFVYCSLDVIASHVVWLCIRQTLH